MKEDVTKIEFLLTLGNNIVCQRYFNVKNFNEKSKRSMDIYMYIKNFCDEMTEDLKIKTSDYLCENSHFFLDNENLNEDENAENDNFNVILKHGDEVFIQRMFIGKYYHPKVRYTVDIRPKLKVILSDLTKILSKKKLDTTYLNYQL